MTNKLRSQRNARVRVVLTLCAVAIVVGSVAIALNLTTDDTSRGLRVLPVIDTAPFIVSADDTSVVVRSVKNGAEVRELASGRDARDVKRIVVSPDGALVYFERQRPRRCPNWDGGNEDEWVTTDYSEIVRVPTAGGPIDHVAWGQDPVMAANGDLFYLSSEGTAKDVIGYPCNADPIEFVRRLRGPRSKGPRKAVYSHNGPAPTFYPSTVRPDGRVFIGNCIDEVAFCIKNSADDDNSERQMLFEMSTPPYPPESNEEDFEGGGVARGVRAITFPAGTTDDSSVIAFVGLSKVAGIVEAIGTRHVATFDPFTGKGTEMLFEVENDVRVVPDKDGQNYLVLNQRGGIQEARRWSSDEGLVHIGTIPVGPVAWTGPML